MKQAQSPHPRADRGTTHARGDRPAGWTSQSVTPLGDDNDGSQYNSRVRHDKEL
jgi:hypothetical protein